LVDSVEIQNVGGYRGVASEATLLALVDSLRRQGSGANTDRTITRMQELHTRSVRESTKTVKVFDKTIEKTVDTLSDFTKELIIGGDRVSDFADAILGSQNVLARFIKFVDGTFDQFRSLTSVGASFNNSMLEMVRSSGEAFMTLDGFVDMVRNNSQALARFGGTVTQGAQSFARFSRDFRMGIGQRFFEMGFAIDDINNGLIGFLELERMRTGRQLRSDRELQSGAANYLLQLDKLTKITGRQRREHEDALQREMQDAGMRSQLNRLEGQARENFANALMILDTELSGPLADGLKDLMDGTAQTQYGQALQSQIPGITEFAQQMFRGGASIEEIYSQLGSRFGPQIERLAGSFSKAQLDQMRMSGGVGAAIAEIIDQGYKLNQFADRDARAAAIEQQRQADIVTKTFGRFQQAIIALRKFLFDRIIESPFAQAIGEIGKDLYSMFSGSGSFPGAVSAVEGAFDSLFGNSGLFTRAVRWISTWIRSGGLTEAFNSLETTIDTFVQRFTKNVTSEGIMGAIGIEFGRLIDHMFGVVDDATGESSGGFFQRMFDGFTGSEFWADFKTRFFEIIFDDASAQREGETFFQTIKRLVIDRLTGVPDSGVDLMTAISNKIKDIFLGPITEISFPNGIETETRQGGLLDQLTQWLFNDENLNRGDFIEKVSEFAGNALSTTIQAFSNLLETSQPLIDAISNKIKDIFLGPITEISFPNGVETETRQGGLLDQLTQWLFNDENLNRGDFIEKVSEFAGNALSTTIQAFSNLLETSQPLIDAISNGFDRLFTMARDSLAELIGMEGDESFGDFARRITNDIQTSINTQLDETISSLRTLIGMNQNESFGDFTRRLIDEVQTSINTQINDLIDIIENRMRSFLGMSESQTFSSLIERLVANLQISFGKVLSAIPGLGDAGIVMQSEGYGSLARLMLSNSDERSVAGSNVATQISEQEMIMDAERRGWYNPARWFGSEYTSEGQIAESIAEELRGAIEGYATGTNGFKDFGKGKLSMLHGAEAVIPRNTPAGELLQAFYDSQNTAQPTTTTSTTSPNYNQSDLITRIDQLNSIMSQVAAILVDQRDIQSKTMRSIKGMGTDLFRGAA
jgi:hypothetical protein